MIALPSESKSSRVLKRSVLNLRIAMPSTVASSGGMSPACTVDPAEGARVAEVLAGHGIYPSELRPDAVDLETVFLELTESNEEDAA